MAGKKEASGRKPRPTGEKAVAKSVTLYPWEWAQIAKADKEGNAAREAAKRLRESLK